MRSQKSGSRAVRSYMRSRAWAAESSPSEPSALPQPPLSVPPIGPAQRVSPEHTHEVIDLLNPEPALVIDQERLSWALSFGFAGGDIGGLLGQAMQRAAVAASDWEPASFAAGLFVSDLIRTCMRVRLGGFEPAIDGLFLTRVLTHPPRDPSVIAHRHAILRELAEGPGQRASFQDLYRALHQLRTLLDSQGPVRELDGRRRRLDVLLAIRDAVQQMAAGFETSSSGLRRIAQFGAHALALEGYRKLVELLDYENHLASVDLKLRVGADGRIRRFEIERVRENRDNQFYQSALGRWLTRVVLVFRGYALAENDLVNRWVDVVFEGVQHLLPALLQLLGEMEVYLAALAFKDTAEAKGLLVCLPVLVDPNGMEQTVGHRFVGLFNPLLFGQASAPIACDLDLGSFRTTTLVTGPNSGGKTRLLQSIALAQMLGQSGFYVPAAAATLSRTRGLFVSLIEEARADQKEGRLGTELMRIRQLFERTHPGSLIVLDELCSGTNPSEGEEIIRLVLSLLDELRAGVFITTHFLQFAKRLSEEPGASTLSYLQVELDDQERPTYRFVPGVAQTSLAHQTASRLGVTREELLALVRRNRPADG